MIPIFSLFLLVVMLVLPLPSHSLSWSVFCFLSSCLATSVDLSLTRSITPFAFFSLLLALHVFLLLCADVDTRVSASSSSTSGSSISSSALVVAHLLMSSAAPLLFLPVFIRCYTVR